MILQIYSWKSLLNEEYCYFIYYWFKKNNTFIDLFQLQTSGLCLLEELVSSLPPPEYWLPEVKQYSLLQTLLASIESWINVQQGAEYVHTVFMLLLTLSKHPQVQCNICKHPQVQCNICKHPQVQCNICKHPQVQCNICKHSQVQCNICKHPQVQCNIWSRDMIRYYTD